MLTLNLLPKRANKRSSYPDRSVFYLRESFTLTLGPWMETFELRRPEDLGSPFTDGPHWERSCPLPSYPSALEGPLWGDLAPPLGPGVSHLSRVPSSSAVHLPSHLPALPSLLSLLHFSHNLTPVNTLLVQKFDQTEGGQLEEWAGNPGPIPQLCLCPNLLYDSGNTFSFLLHHSPRAVWAGPVFLRD